MRADIAIYPDWPKPRAPLALDLRFSTTNRQPPSLARLPKNYLDLLGATHAPDEDPGPVLYNDDRTISMLYAAATNSWTPEQPQTAAGQILITARTRADALADLALASRLSDGDGPKFEAAQQPQSPDHWEHDEARETVRMLRQSGDERSQHTANMLEHYQRSADQRSYLQSRDAALAAVMLSDGHRLLTGRDPAQRALRSALSNTTFENAPASRLLPQSDTLDYRHMILSSTGPIELPPLPTSAGQGQQFRADVDAILAGFARRQPGLIPLVEPLRVTVLVIPPKRDAKTGKDLDNILLDVLGSVDRQLKPPAEPLLLAPYDDFDADVLGDRLEDWRRNGLARLKSLGETAIWAYQVLELARHRHDPQSGRLMLVLGSGQNMHSVWDEAAAYVDAQHDAMRRW